MHSIRRRTSVVLVARWAAWWSLMSGGLSVGGLVYVLVARWAAWWALMSGRPSWSDARSRRSSSTRTLDIDKGTRRCTLLRGSTAAGCEWPSGRTPMCSSRPSCATATGLSPDSRDFAVVVPRPVAVSMRGMSSSWSRDDGKCSSGCGWPFGRTHPSTTVPTKDLVATRSSSSTSWSDARSRSTRTLDMDKGTRRCTLLRGSTAAGCEWPSGRTPMCSSRPSRATATGHSPGSTGCSGTLASNIGYCPSTRSSVRWPGRTGYDPGAAARRRSSGLANTPTCRTCSIGDSTDRRSSSRTIRTGSRRSSTCPHIRCNSSSRRWSQSCAVTTDSGCDDCNPHVLNTGRAKDRTTARWSAMRPAPPALPHVHTPASKPSRPRAASGHVNWSWSCLPGCKETVGVGTGARRRAI